MVKARQLSRRAFSVFKHQTACKPGSVWRSCLHVAAIPLGRPLPGASSSQPGWLARRPAGFRRVIPIWLCSRWGLPCRFCCQTRGALLPHLFTLTLSEDRAVCSLWHFPWGRPRRTLSGTASSWSPDFPRR